MTSIAIHRSGPARPLVALAEDDADLRALYLDALSPSFDVVECDDGVALLDYLGRAGAGELPYPDVLVTDQLMPGLSGLDVLAEVRRQYPFLPALVVTALASDSVREQATRLGAMTVLPKPVDIEALSRWVDASRAALEDSARRRGQGPTRHLVDPGGALP